MVSRQRAVALGALSYSLACYHLSCIHVFATLVKRNDDLGMHLIIVRDPLGRKYLGIYFALSYLFRGSCLSMEIDCAQTANLLNQSTNSNADLRELRTELDVLRSNRTMTPRFPCSMLLLLPNR